MDSSIIISRDVANRLIKDIRQIIRNPLTEHGIHYHHDQSNMLKGYAMIIGPHNTPYENGYYLFEFNFPANYPNSPPVVIFHTNDGVTRFNPNLYKNGKVCVSVLNTWSGEQWSGCQTISSILLTLCSLLCENPLLNEPGITTTSFSNQCQIYKDIIEYKNIEFAIGHFISKKYKLNNNFQEFYPIMINVFNENYNLLISKLESKILTTKNTNLYNSTYNMHTYINFTGLLKFIKECNIIIN
jgi:ubiquitin-conjugating enzyme E2 Z